MVVAAPEHRFSGMDAVPLAELAAEPLVHYDPDNGIAVWLDQFAAATRCCAAAAGAADGQPAHGRAACRGWAWG